MTKAATQYEKDVNFVISKLPDLKNLVNGLKIPFEYGTVSINLSNSIDQYKTYLSLLKNAEFDMQLFEYECKNNPEKKLEAPLQEHIELAIRFFKEPLNQLIGLLQTIVQFEKYMIEQLFSLKMNAKKWEAIQTFTAYFLLSRAATSMVSNKELRHFCSIVGHDIGLFSCGRSTDIGLLYDGNIEEFHAKAKTFGQKLVDPFRFGLSTSLYISSKALASEEHFPVERMLYHASTAFYARQLFNSNREAFMQMIADLNGEIFVIVKKYEAI